MLDTISHNNLAFPHNNTVNFIRNKICILSFYANSYSEFELIDITDSLENYLIR